MRYRLTLLLLLSAILIPFAINCGKKANPLPPIVIAPDRANQPRVRQSGEQMIFFFQMPVYNTEGGGLADIDRIEIYRLKDARIPIGEETQTQTAPQTQTQPQTQSQPNLSLKLKPRHKHNRSRKHKRKLHHSNSNRTFSANTDSNTVTNEPNADWSDSDTITNSTSSRGRSTRNRRCRF